MSKILRGTGLVLVVTGIVMNRVFWKDIYRDGMAKLFVETIGNTAGSIYATCDEASLLAKIGGTEEFQSHDSSDLSYNFYDIDNPTDYLKGSDAIVVEKGPYKMKKHTLKYGLAFKGSALTEDAANDKSAIEFNEANLYVSLDENTDVKKTKMTRGVDLSLTWLDGEIEDVASYEKTTPTHLSMNDKITNLSPIYQSIIGEANDELSLILSMSCTPKQIGNIFAADTKNQCDNDQINDMEEEDCFCCMLRDMYTAQGNPAGVLECDSFLQDSGVVVSDLSLLAYFDGGVAIKEAGELNFSGSGNFVQTMHKQTKIYSPVIQTHTVNEWLFGHPSAYVAKVITKMYFAQALKIMKDNGFNSRSDTAKELLTGNMDDILPMKLGDVALYTKNVGSVCLGECADASPLTGSRLDFMCDGYAPERHESSAIDDILLGGISCKPYSATYATMQMCNEIDIILQGNPLDTDNELCMCADSSEDYKTSGCCLASGKYKNEDLTADGCLYPVEGMLGNNYVGRYTATGDKPTIDLGKSAEALVARESSKVSSLKTTQFVCPKATDPVKNLPLTLAELSHFGYYEAYEGTSSHVTYHHTGNPRIRQTDASTNDVAAYSVNVKASSTQYYKPTGLTGYFNERSLTNGHTYKGAVPVYMKGMKAPIDFTEDWGVRAIFCDQNDVDKLCHIVSRLRPSKDAFTMTNVTALAGTGLPYSGVQAIGSMEGPTTKGRPAYFHNPLYVHGDEDLLSQQDNAHVDSLDGNGIKIYRAVNPNDDPGSFSTGNTQFAHVTSNANLTKVNHEFLEQTSYESYIDIEPATGLGVRTNLRHGVSHSLWECDPESNDNCKLSKGGKCYSSTYPCSAANVFTPDVIGGKIIPTFWYEDKSQPASDDEITELSSKANGYHDTQFRYGWRVNLALYLSWILGLPLLAQVGCFAPEKAYLKQSPDAAKTAASVASGAAASAASAVE